MDNSFVPLLVLLPFKVFTTLTIWFPSFYRGLASFGMAWPIVMHHFVLVLDSGICMWWYFHLFGTISLYGGNGTEYRQPKTWWYDTCAFQNFNFVYKLNLLHENSISLTRWLSVVHLWFLAENKFITKYTFSVLCIDNCFLAQKIKIRNPFWTHFVWEKLLHG